MGLFAAKQHHIWPFGMTLCSPLLRALFTSARLILLLISPLTAAQPSASFIDEADAYLNVKPRHSLDIIQQHQGKVSALSLPEQFRYYRTGFWASAYVYDHQQVAEYARALASMVQFEAYNSSLSEVLAATSVWFRRNQGYLSAMAAAQCAVRHADNSTDIARVAGTAGITLLLKDDVEGAERVFQLGMEIGNHLDNDVMRSVFTNNLGLIALQREHYDTALEQFRGALLINERDARITGTAINLTNMLLVAYLQQNWDLFKRLDQRAARNTARLDSKDLLGYYQWLHTAYSVRQLQQVPQSVEDKLMRIYHDIGEPTVLQQLGILAKRMDIIIPSHTKAKGKIANPEQVLQLLCKGRDDNNTVLHIALQLEAKLASMTQAKAGHQ
ncbi:hypothetical protein [Pseudoalteromonas 'SMAR']|uniref:hypothetical protein n=1 Tax=Pseudoalteromonas 'SMAR' TaxID=3416908 RepID=UPI003AF2C3C0